MKKIIVLLTAVLTAISCNRLNLPDNWQEKNAEALQNAAFVEAVKNIDKEQIWVANGGLLISGVTVTPTDGTKVSMTKSKITKSDIITTPADYFRILWGPKTGRELNVRIETQGSNITEYGLYYYQENDVRVKKPVAATGASKVNFAGNADTDCFGVYIVKDGKEFFSESRYNEGLVQDCSFVAQADQKEITSNRAYIYLKDAVFKINSNDDIIGLDYDRGPWMVICEDCGVQADNDFNDVVFIVHRLDATHVKLEYCATGATLVDSIHYKADDLGEIHDIMGIPEGTMINVYKDEEPHHFSEVIEVPKELTLTTGNFGGFSVICNGTSNAIGEVLDRGYAPYMIAVPSFMKWDIECTPIFTAYPEFITWAQDHTKCVDWFMHPAAGTVVEK